MPNIWWCSQAHAASPSLQGGGSQAALHLGPLPNFLSPGPGFVLTMLSPPLWGNRSRPWQDGRCHVLEGDCRRKQFSHVHGAYLDFPDSSVGKESACNAGDPSSIPGLGRSTGEGIGYPLQYSWTSLVAQLRIHLQCGRPRFNPWVGKIPWRRERLPIPVFWPGEVHELHTP